jgi:hypothetical protein
MKTWFIAILCLFISACASTQATAPVIQTKERLVSIPSTLLEPCQTPIPPSVTDYTGKDIRAQKELLRAYAVQLLISLNKCNEQIAQIGKVQKQQQNTLNGVNNSEGISNGNTQ